MIAVRDLGDNACRHRLWIVNFFSGILSNTLVIQPISVSQLLFAINKNKFDCLKSLESIKWIHNEGQRYWFSCNELHLQLIPSGSLSLRPFHKKWQMIIDTEWLSTWPSCIHFVVLRVPGWCSPHFILYINTSTTKQMSQNGDKILRSRNWFSVQVNAHRHPLFYFILFYYLRQVLAGIPQKGEPITAVQSKPLPSSEIKHRAPSALLFSNCAWVLLSPESCEQGWVARQGLRFILLIRKDKKV